MSIDTIKQREENATKGPWWWYKDGMTGTDGRGIIETDGGVYPPTENDRDFIAHSRTDIPLLLAVAEAARKYEALVPLMGIKREDFEVAQAVVTELTTALAALEASK